MDKNYQTDMIVLDFAKAFDKVSHPRLLHKLEHYGIHGNNKNWIKSFLNNRTQAVKSCTSPISWDSQDL
jgi:hypothetical protein